MINFQNRQDMGASGVILCSILIMLITLIYELTVKVPSSVSLANGRIQSKKKLQHEIAFTKTEAKALELKVKGKLWTGNADRITAAILSKTTLMAKQYSLGLTAFRPQKPQTLEGVMELPYSIIVTGTFPSVQKAARQLEDSGNRLALRSIQFASSDAASSSVSATLNISAFVELKEAPSEPKTGAKKR